MTHWEPSVIPAAVRLHWASCPNCPHTVEWHWESPDAAGVSLSAPHLDVGEWRLLHSTIPAGLRLTIKADTGELLYGAWFPQGEALRLRDQLLLWWPVTRHPVKGG